jgi:hypothetical protein
MYFIKFQVPPGMSRQMGPPRRNGPIRSQSMSQADASRFYFPNASHLRHVAGTKGVEIQEVFDSEDEEDDEGVVSDGKVGKIRRHFIHHNNQVQFTKTN